MKIWHVAEVYPPDYGGGAALTVQAFCRMLAARGHEVRVLCTEKSENAPYTIQDEVQDGVRISRATMPTRFGKCDPEGWGLGLSGWRAHEQQIAALLKRHLADWQPDVAHYHTARPFGEICIPTIAQSGVPVVTTLHDGWLICPRLYLLRSPDSQPCSGPSPVGCVRCMYSHYDRSAFQAVAKLPWRVFRQGLLPAVRLPQRRNARRQVTRITAPAKWLAAIHQPHVERPIQFLPLGIDLDGLPQSRPARGAGVIRFGFVGGFQPHKGIRHLLRAAQNLKKRGLQFELQLWGPVSPGAERMLEEYELGGCGQLRGAFTPADRWQTYGAMDVLVVATTVCEPFGLVIQEARAMGRPSIAPNLGGPAEQIQDGQDGLLYQFREPADLEKQMARLIECPELLAQLTHQQPPPLMIQDTITALEQVYAELLDPASSLSPVAPAG